MTDRVVERLRAAAEEAVHGIELERPGGGSEVAPATSHRPRGRWLTAAASLIAAAVVGVVVWGVNSGPSEPAPAAPAPAPEAPAAPRELLRSAVGATRRAPAWMAEVSGGVGETLFVHQEPDRLETRVAGSDGEWVTKSVHVGADMYVLDDGEWTIHQQDWRTSAPSNLLDELERLECVVGDGRDLTAWLEPDEWEEPTGDCPGRAEQVPADLPFRSLVWSVSLDAEGRLRSVDRRQVLEVDGQRVVDPDPTAEDPFDRTGAVAGTRVELRYDDVPPVTVPDGVVGGS